MSDFPPIASLRSFEAVARLGSVTLAAKELHVTHSAISQQIKVLEEMVGLKLFIRHGRGVQINEDGRLYALQVREALHHIADATRLVQVKPSALMRDLKERLCPAVCASTTRTWFWRPSGLVKVSRWNAAR